MKISGYSFVRNGVSLYYPVVESILSILPLCHEFVVAVGKSSPGDTTREAIASIKDPKVRIIDTEWEEKDFSRGAVNSLQSDVARKECTGDWLFYLQADEVVHERFLPVIEARCRSLLSDARVEGLLFRYKHFWGDYSHYADGHAWYSHEIRLTRNLPEIHSWHSAQSFRFFERYESPWQDHSTRKLRVAPVDAEIYHYGWVRPPRLMQTKRKALISVHKGIERTNSEFENAPDHWDYGPIHRLPVFAETHPHVMAEFISRMDWQDELNYSGGLPNNRPPFKHETFRNRALSFLEKTLFGGNPPFGRKNWELVNV